MTATSELLAKIVARESAALRLVHDVNIAITPNIGRNFGPLLVEFGEALSNYQLVCHLHTKRSSHTASFSGWGDYLVENLVGNPELILSIIHKMDTDPQCGLAYPKRFAKVPEWAQHWLNNYDIGEHWCRYNGLQVENGPVEFPTGGMFWARPSAILQLLLHRWKYSDFPSEQGQIDGTTQHAVERLVGAVARSNGFTSWIYQPRITEVSKTDGD